MDFAILQKLYGTEHGEKHMRRFTRLTNAFSKKAENHAHPAALHFMHDSFVRIHKTRKVTPAIAAGVTCKLWEIADVVALLPSGG